MATKIKLARFGKMRSPYYRIVVADARNKRDGRSIETIGRYEPKEDPSFIEVDSERAQYWLSVGAQPTDAVAAIFRVTGDWQKFKGEPAPAPMLVAAPKADKHAAFADAAAVAAGEAEGGSATTPKKKAAPKKTAKADDVPVEASTDAPAEAASAAEETPAAAAEVETPAADEAVEAVAEATASTEA